MEKKPDPKEAVAQAMAQIAEQKRWEPIFIWLGLNEESRDRLTRLLVLHLSLDRALTALITMELLDTTSSFSEMEETIAALPMKGRIGLAQATNLISKSCAKNIGDLNAVRNNLAHYKPKLGHGLGGVREISSEEAFYECTRKALAALTEVTCKINDGFQPEEGPEANPPVPSP